MADRRARAVHGQASAATSGAPARDRSRPGDEAHGGPRRGRGVQLVSRVYAQLERLEWLVRLVVRLSVGIEFFGSGLGKLGKLPGFIQFFRSLGIPFPEVQAPFVAGVELICGALIVVGLGTRPAALMLCGVMSVAIVTAAVPEKKITASWHGLLEFFYLPEWCLLLLLGWLLFAGPGRASLGALVGGRGSEGAGGKRRSKQRTAPRSV